MSRLCYPQGALNCRSDTLNIAEDSIMSSLLLGAVCIRQSSMAKMATSHRLGYCLSRMIWCAANIQVLLHSATIERSTAAWRRLCDATGWEVTAELTRRRDRLQRRGFGLFG
jgi:hypothetical protein